MKRNVLVVIASGAIALGASAIIGLFVVVQAQPGAGGGGKPWHGQAFFGLQNLTEKLNMTSDQQSKVQPIIDQAEAQIAAIHQQAMQKKKTAMDSTDQDEAQIAAIHQEAMQKMETVMDNTLSQIRPLLGPDQQTKLDAIHTRFWGP
jgi:Spy/CpxP family protein refolding chaperone